MAKSKSQKEYLEKEIKSRIKALDSQHYQHIMNEQYNEHYNVRSDEMESWMFDTLKRIYLLIIAYFECREMSIYATIFKDRFESKLQDGKFMLENYLPPFDEISEGKLSRLREFEDFLMPFPEFDIFKEEKKNTSNFLETILKHSNSIVKKTNTEIKNESSIYNIVKWFIGLLFPDAHKVHNDIFPGRFTYYKGDIAIPAIETVIEYKLIKPADNAEKYIDQLKSDSLNYKDNEKFSRFYAVMYFLDNKEHKEEEILECWKSKNFPGNWKLIQVFD
jgi:hypothetical protein